MVLNDNWISAPTERLQRALGHNPQKSSFVRLCHGSCRGGPGNLHLKVYAFSRTGSAKDVVITGSSNLTDRAVSLQWNDLYTVADDGLYGLFVKIFNQLKLDKPHRPRWVEYSSDQLRANFYRTKSGAAHHVRVLPAPRRVSQADDPVMKRLRAVRCRTAKGFGIDRRTSIRIIMYAWQGNRGKYIAERVARLKREGCSVRIILSVPGGGVLKVLHGAGIAMRSADWNYLPSGIVNMYSHLKVLMVDGTYRGKPTRTLWTGSENWSPMSFRNDELTIQLSKPKAFSDYRRRFASLWLKGTHELGVHPTGKPQG
jgi:phosphatidylserine/phosphatidylglycerophosphate/cardiolipin synthase-like enzyme